MSQAVGLVPKQIACAPRALLWAGMSQAVGLKITVDEIPWREDKTVETVGIASRRQRHPAEAVC